MSYEPFNKIGNQKPDYQFSQDIKIKNIEELNKKIEKLNNSFRLKNEIISVTESGPKKNIYDIVINDFYIDPSINYQFAKILSKHITEGSADLIYGEKLDEINAFRVFPNKVVRLENILVPKNKINKIQKYIDSL